LPTLDLQYHYRRLTTFTALPHCPQQRTDIQKLTLNDIDSSKTQALTCS
jgi:hypothetical protein